jgi:hypothetical protein
MDKALFPDGRTAGASHPTLASRHLLYHNYDPEIHIPCANFVATRSPLRHSRAYAIRPYAGFCVEIYYAFFAAILPIFESYEDQRG